MASPSRIRKNLQEVFGQQVLMWLPLVLYQIIEAIRQDLKPAVANRLVALIIVATRSDKVLTSNDFQQTVAGIASAIVSNTEMRRLVDKGLEELTEKSVGHQDAFTPNPNGDQAITKRNVERASEVLLSLKPSLPGLDSGEAKGEAKTSSPSSEKTVLQIVGELDEEKRRAFSALVNRLQKKLNDGVEAQPNVEQPGDEVTLLITNRVGTREEILAILDAKPQGMQEDLLLQTLRQAMSPGGSRGGLARLLNRATGLAESALPTGQSPGGGKLVDDLGRLNRRREHRDRKVNRFR